jgi:hypothetical protein
VIVSAVRLRAAFPSFWSVDLWLKLVLWVVCGGSIKCFSFILLTFYLVVVVSTKVHFKQYCKEVGDTFCKKKMDLNYKIDLK